MQENQYASETISLAYSEDYDWEKDFIAKIKGISPTSKSFDLDCRGLHLRCSSIKKIQILADKAGKKLIAIKSNVPETIISASALGFRASYDLHKNKQCSPNLIKNESNLQEGVLFKQGTLRSGETLDSDKDILLLGDINPGATISAGGNVMIWGRLRGNAHAGKYGNFNAKIIAHELRPVQLRIANKIARGPQEKPEPGFTEEALIENDEIIIRPARANSFNNF